MSDRVEEKREEQRLLEQRLLTQRQETKRSETSRAFSTFVETAQKTKGEHTRSQEGRQQQGRQQGQASAQQRLVVRRGIDNSEYGNRLAADGDQSLRSRREADVRAGKKATSLREQQGNPQESVASRVNTVQERSDRKPKEQIKDDDKRTAQEARRELALGSQTGQAVMAMAGVSPKQGSSGAGASALNPQRMIEEIVKAVHKGVDARGFGVMHIELKENTFGGHAATSLTVQAHADGISMAVHTEDEQISRLLSAGSTAHELSVALESKGIKLKSLEVNDNKVIR